MVYKIYCHQQIIWPLYPLKNRSCSCFVFFLLSDPRPLKFEHLLESVDLAPWWRLEICVQLSVTYMHGMHGRSLFENEKQRFWHGADDQSSRILSRWRCQAAIILKKYSENINRNTEILKGLLEQGMLKKCVQQQQAKNWLHFHPFCQFLPVSTDYWQRLHKQWTGQIFLYCKHAFAFIY